MPTQFRNSGITVVVPVYNRAGLLTRCLDSIAAQTVRPLSVIVVDNNSSDGSLEVARLWADAHLSDLDVSVLSETRPGAARARQTGLEHVDTEWVLFFDSDDVMASDILVHTLPTTHDADMICWKRELNGLDGTRTVSPYRPKDVLRCHMYNGMLSTLSYMARTELVIRAGGWNTSVRVWDDWEVGFRLLFQKPRVKCLDRIGAIVYSQEESITGTSFSAKAGQWEAIIDMVQTYMPDNKEFVQMLDYRRVNLAASYTREGHPELGKELLRKTLRRTCCDAPRKLLLRMIYLYTRLGGRGAYHLWR